MIVFGQIFSKKSPKEINIYFGYRTSMSRKNMDTWNFAHNYFGKLWRLMGIILLPLSILTMIFCVNDKTNNVIGLYTIIILIIQTFVMIFSIFLTEKELKKVFDENGDRK
jgi:uncharacterized membrane protein